VTVVDAGTLCQALAGAPTEDLASLRRRLSQPLSAPTHIDLEVCSVIRRYVLAREISEQVGSRLLGDFTAMPLRRHDLTPLLPRVWELRHNLTPYDAAYVALAEQTRSVLLTSDHRVANAPGTRCEIEVWPVPPDL
jgi:predicted nucleic acid-binding protein